MSMISPPTQNKPKGKPCPHTRAPLSPTPKSHLPMETLSETTPMDPVIVDGWAMILSQADAIMYTPLAARSPMEQMTGLPACRTDLTAAEMESLATAEPPPESMRRTTAPILGSWLTFRSCFGRMEWGWGGWGLRIGCPSVGIFAMVWVRVAMTITMI